MGIDHSNPYIHSTTVLCDSNAGNNDNVGNSSLKQMRVVRILMNRNLHLIHTHYQYMLHFLVTVVAIYPKY